MRVTIVHPHAGLEGGVRVTAAYAQRLVQRGHRLAVRSTLPRVPSLRRRICSLARRGEWLHRLAHGASHFDGLALDWRVVDGPVTSRDVPDADVVIATWWETAEWVNDFPPCKGAHVHFIQHDEREMYPNEDYKTRQRATAVWGLPSHKIVIAKWLAELAKARCASQPVSLIPNSVDTTLFRSPPRQKAGVPTVGVMYSTTHFKGCDISLEAVRRAAAVVPSLRLVSFGASPPTQAMPLPPNSEYFANPAQQELPNLYSRCDAWLFGSRSEGFGLPIIEAMACRTPVIATPAGAAPELLSSGGGILLDSADAGAMANAIIEVARMPTAAWRAMSDEAYTMATAYTWDDAADHFEAALKDAVAAARGPDELQRGNRSSSIIHV